MTTQHQFDPLFDTVILGVIVYYKSTAGTRGDAPNYSKLRNNFDSPLFSSIFNHVKSCDCGS